MHLTHDAAAFCIEYAVSVALVPCFVAFATSLLGLLLSEGCRRLG